MRQLADADAVLRLDRDHARRLALQPMACMMWTMVILLIGLYQHPSLGLKVDGFRSEALCEQAMDRIGTAYADTQRRAHALTTTIIVTTCVQVSEQ